MTDRMVVLGHRAYQELGYLDAIVGHRRIEWSFREGGHHSPPLVEEGDLVVSLGSLWSPDDKRDEVVAEKRYIEGALAHGAFVVGCCFGGQLLGDIFGRPPRRRESPHLGFDRILDPSSGEEVDAFFWNEYEFGRPAGGTLLAGSDEAAQVVLLPSALAVQPHVEVSLPMLRRWMDESGSYFDTHGADSRRILLQAAQNDNERRQFAEGLYRLAGL